jgi:ABC-type proline/glycine betaine transport system substrate-binding protein
VGIVLTSLNMGTGATGAPTSGSTVTVNAVGWGNAQASIKLTAQ